VPAPDRVGGIGGFGGTPGVRQEIAVGLFPVDYGRALTLWRGVKEVSGVSLMVAQEVPTSTTMALPHGPTGVADARRRLRADLFARDVPEPVVDDAVLILSELLSNSCRHARPLGESDEAGHGNGQAGAQAPAGRLQPPRAPQAPQPSAARVVQPRGALVDGSVTGPAGHANATARTGNGVNGDAGPGPHPGRSAALASGLGGPESGGPEPVGPDVRGPELHRADPGAEAGIRAAWSVGPDGLLVLEVTDGGGPTRPRPSSPSLTAHGGRGLGIVGNLALRWGVRDAPGEVTVWAVLAVRGRHARRDDSLGTGIGLPMGVPLDLPLDLAESLDDLG
jgi:hypothetical protein